MTPLSQEGDVVMSDAAAESRLPLPVPQQDSESAFYLRNNAVMMRESLKESKRLFINGPPGCGKSSEVVLFIADQLRDDSKKKALLIHSPPKPGGSIINVTLIANSQITASPVQLPLSEAAILSLVDHFKPDLLVLDGARGESHAFTSLAMAKLEMPVIIVCSLQLNMFKAEGHKIALFAGLGWCADSLAAH